MQGRCECGALVKETKGPLNRVLKACREKGYVVDGFLVNRKRFWLWCRDKNVYITDSYHPFCPFCRRVFITEGEGNGAGEGA